MYTGEERRAEGDLRERVAVLETQHESLVSKLDAVLQKHDEILKELTRYKGFIGGVVFVVSGAIVLWNISKDWILGHLR